MINENIIKKIQNADSKCRQNLLMIAKDEQFSQNEELFDLVLSQTSVHSQNIIYRAIKEGVKKDIIYLLIQNTDGYLKQERILRYSKYDSIMKDEIIFLDMLNIENEYVEEQLFKLLQMNKIRSTEQYYDKKKEFISISKFKGLTKKEDEELTEADYQELKQKRILRDNVLKDVKKVLRNFGFLGIDIPRVDDKNKDKNDVVKSFNSDEYQKLFNVDDFGEERLFVNGTITNAKSNCNFVELVIIFKELLNKYQLNDYKVNIYDEEIYNLTTKYYCENVSLVSDNSDIIKFKSNNDEELVNISKLNGNIVFGLKVDKLVDYIVDEKKEKTVSEENLRDTIIYVDESMQKNRRLYDSLINNYLYDYHAIIVYKEDLPKDKLFDYCIKNNIRFVGFLEGTDDFRVLPTKDLVNKTKTLGLSNEGVK